MLNFPADDLAVLFTPHLWPSVTFHAALSPPGLGTATAQEWGQDLKAGSPPSATNSRVLGPLPVSGLTLSELLWGIRGP